MRERKASINKTCNNRDKREGYVFDVEAWEIASTSRSGKQLKAVVTKELMCFRLLESRTWRLLKHESAYGGFSFLEKNFFLFKNESVCN